MAVTAAVGRTARAVGSGTTSTVGAGANLVRSAAGAITGSALGAGTGAIQGAVRGASAGAESGSRSTPAALLTLGALGIAGVIDWPIVVAGGAIAVLVSRTKGKPQSAPRLPAMPAKTAAPRKRASARQSNVAPTTPASAKRAPTKAARARTRSTKASAAKRVATGKQSRSGANS